MGMGSRQKEVIKVKCFYKEDQKAEAVNDILKTSFEKYLKDKLSKLYV